VPRFVALVLHLGQRFTPRKSESAFLREAVQCCTRLGPLGPEISLRMQAFLVCWANRGWRGSDTSQRARESLNPSEGPYIGWGSAMSDALTASRSISVPSPYPSVRWWATPDATITVLLAGGLMSFFSVLFGAVVHAGISPYGLGNNFYTVTSAGEFAVPAACLGVGSFLLAWGFTRSFRTSVQFSSRTASGTQITLVRESWLVAALSTFFFGYGLVWLGLLVPYPGFYFSQEWPPQVPSRIIQGAEVLVIVGLVVLGVGLAVITAIEIHRRRSLRL
jgi:hypothetical protein